MKLRTRLDMFSAALLSALGASSLVACGGAAVRDTGGDPNRGGASNSAGAGNSAGTTSNAGASNRAGADNNGGAGNSGGTTSNAGAGSTSSGGASNRFPCKNPKDLGNGLIQCDGFVERVRVATCASSLPRPKPTPSSRPEASCELDVECIDKPHGWCGDLGGNVQGPYCIYGCVKDSECAANQLCLCGDPVGRCVQVDGCSTDADCASGFACKSHDSSGGCGVTTFSCQSPADECGSDSDCAGKAGADRCMYDVVNKRFGCTFAGCQVGRPFLVEGEQRQAAMSTRADWRELALLPRLGEIDASLRAHLADRWTRIALMEHASIAAFARFSLQLLSLGAPPDLLERTTSAMADETKHAKACFAVASEYAGAPVGPGRLELANSLDDLSLEQIVLTTIREGCVGETVAAIEAREAAEHAADPALRALLFVISEDETRHAELAFRFVQWALTQGDATLERAVRTEFAALSRENPVASAPHAPHAQSAASLAHGIVPEPMRQEIRARAIREVILPCASALYAPPANRSTAAALPTNAPSLSLPL